MLTGILLCLKLLYSTIPQEQCGLDNAVPLPLQKPHTMSLVQSYNRALWGGISSTHNSSKPWVQCQVRVQVYNWYRVHTFLSVACIRSKQVLTFGTVAVYYNPGISGISIGIAIFSIREFQEYMQYDCKLRLCFCPSYSVAHRTAGGHTIRYCMLNRF